MQHRFSIQKINALNDKGKLIPGTIEPIHTEYRLDLPEEESKLYLFALSRRGRALERAKTLRLVVNSLNGERNTSTVRVKVLYADSFGLDNVADGDYWNEIPESLRFDIQDELADQLMARAQPEKIGFFPVLSSPERERHPYQGVTFAVSELDELEALFPPE